MERRSIGIRLRRPRKDSLGATSGEECAIASEQGTRTTRGIAMWFYCFATPSVEPPLAANIGGHSMWEDVGRNPHATYATRVTLCSTISPSLAKLVARELRCTVECERKLQISPTCSCEGITTVRG